MADLADWRCRIDEIDGELVTLLNERASCAREIGEIKHETGLEVHDPNREKQILDRIRNINTGPFGNDELVGIFETIIASCRKIEM